MKGGVLIAICKDLKTDSGKKSLKGYIKVVGDPEKGITAIDGVSFEESQKGLLELVFLDGALVIETLLEEIRGLVKTQLTTNFN